MTTASNKTTAILNYALAGFSVFPAIGKIPEAPGWKTTPYDPLIDPSRFTRNYGVVLRPTDLVVDVDPRGFAPNDDPFTRLLPILGDAATKTYAVATGGYGNGRHIYFSLPLGTPKLRYKVEPEFQGIQFSTVGRYVMGPGSIHPDTNREYTVLHGAPMGILPAPKALIDLLRTQEGAMELEQRDVFSTDEPTRLRFVNFLTSAPIAVEGANGDNTTYRTAAMGRDLGLSPQDTFELMATHWNDRCAPPWTADELLVKVQNVYKYAKSTAGCRSPLVQFGELLNQKTDTPAEIPNVLWNLTQKGSLVLNDSLNTRNYLVLETIQGRPNPLHGLVRYNELSGKMEYCSIPPWYDPFDKVGEVTDNDLTELCYSINRLFGYRTSKALVYEAVSTVARLNSYHPIRVYLNTLVWDGTPRIDCLLTQYAGVEDSQYTRAISKCFMLAAVARVFSPGAKFDQVLILEGAQGIGKSTFVEALARGWYVDMFLDSHSKDSTLALEGAWIIELSEMDFLKRSEATAFKAFFARKEHKIRKPYDRMPTTHQMQSVFVGTTNPEGPYLPDQTGNRRFWPVRCSRFNIPQLRHDLDQLWAEATFRYKTGEQFHLTPAEEALAREQQARRQASDPWVYSLGAWINNSATSRPYAVGEILLCALGIPPVRQRLSDATRVASILTNTYGWASVRIGEDVKLIAPMLLTDR